MVIFELSIHTQQKSSKFLNWKYVRQVFQHKFKIFTDCPQLEDISKGYIQCTLGNKVGSECTYVCNPSEYRIFEVIL